MSDPALSADAVRHGDFVDLFDHAPCGYFVTDRGGVVVRANLEFARLVGDDLDSIVGRRTLPSFLTAGGRIFLETHLVPVLGHDGTIREIDLDLVAADGSRRQVLLNANSSGEGAAMRGAVFETPDRHRYERDLREATHRAESATRASAALAQTLQRTFIPPVPPTIPFLTVAAAYRPAGDGTTVGGDFYDIFQTGPTTWLVALGDVSGKGVEAATVTTFVRYTIRALAMNHDDPSDLMRQLDRLVQISDTEHYCTVVLARLSLTAEGVRMDVCLAGHPPPLLRDRAGTTTEIGIYGTPVGLVDAAVFETASVRLSDEIVVLYTDGVTEARGRNDMFGERRLTDLVSSSVHDPSQITDAVVDAALRHQDDQASDDIAIVCFAVRADRAG